MAKVGDLIFQTEDYAEGHIRTRTMKLAIRLYKNKEKKKDNHPDFIVKELVEGDEVPIGNGWINKIKNGPNSGGEFLSMSLDDPSFPMVLDVSAFKVSENEFEIVWNRKREA